MLPGTRGKSRVNRRHRPFGGRRQVVGRGASSAGRRLEFEMLEPRQLLAAVIYGDALESPFQNWSWSTTVDFANSSVVQSGTSAISASHDAAWAGLYLRSVPDTSMAADEEIRFYVNGGSTGGQSIQVNLVETIAGTDQFTTLSTINPLANTWTEVTIDFADPGAPPALAGLVFQDATGSGNATFYLDSIEIGDFVPDNPQAGPTITVDPSSVIRPINDGIYGMNFADDVLAQDTSLPLERWGGNSTTRYNYQLDATNIASDYFFENYPSETVDVTTLPAGSTADYFVADAQANGSDTIMTIGTIGWTPNSRDIQGSFPVDVYGPQQQVDPWRPNFGNGIALDGSFIVNDPLITSNPVDETFATDWINHLIAEHGDANSGGVNYYALDNEPMLWNSTHRDVHPDPASYDEVRDRGILYASAIKDADPGAQVLGPTVWGWTAYFYSALDSAAGGNWWENPADRNAHGGEAFLPWYLAEMAEAEAQGGTRLLDYLDIHYYPQTPNVALAPVGDAQVQADRLQSTRSLWDSTYVDDSWINTEIALIPRMRDWIDTNYPGTGLAITEYNFGGVEHINGAVTQADVLGIFGREGVDLATMWSPPDADDPAGFAFRMFRNYDGSGTVDSQFGDFSLQADSSDDNSVSVFAARRSSDDALTIMLVNKSLGTLTTPIDLSDAVGDVTAEVYTYDASNLSAIVQGSDLTFDDGAADIDLAGTSITLIEIPSSTIRGDFDADGELGVADIDLLCAAISSGSHDVTFDLTGDGLVDVADMNEMIMGVVGTLFGDANLDGSVDVSDFAVINANRFTFATSWGAGNFNCDGAVDASDFAIWNSAKFESPVSITNLDDGPADWLDAWAPAVTTPTADVVMNDPETGIPNRRSSVNGVAQLEDAEPSHRQLVQSSQPVVRPVQVAGAAWQSSAVVGLSFRQLTHQRSFHCEHGGDTTGMSSGWYLKFDADDDPGLEGLSDKYVNARRR